MKRSIVVSILTLSVVFSGLGQDSEYLHYPIVGHPMPDFVLKNIKYWKKKEATLKDFRGKWLVLDFWNKACGACVASFPTESKIQEELGDKVQVMMVGYQDEERMIEPMFDKFRSRLNLKMPCAFDSDICNTFDISMAPHIVLIDDRGIVRCVTMAMNANDVRDFIAGKEPSLPSTYTRMATYLEQGKELKKYDPRKPFMVDNNGAPDSDFLFRSVLAKWDRTISQGYFPSKINEHKDGRFEILGAPLETLYKFAYIGVGYWDFNDSSRYGKLYDKLVLLLRDSAQFNYSYKYNRNLFSYSLIVPKRSHKAGDMERIMQKDLSMYFPFSVSVEKRPCPCWKMTISESTRRALLTRGGARYYEGQPHAGFKAVNVEYVRILERIRSVIPGYILDETNLSGQNIDIDLDYVDTDYQDLIRALKLHGIELVPATVTMTAIVVRDRLTEEPSSLVQY